MPRIHWRTGLGTCRTGNRPTADRLVRRVRAVIGVGRIIQKKRALVGRRITHVCIQKLQRMIRVPAAEFREHVGVIAFGHELFTILRGPDGRAPV